MQRLSARRSLVASSRASGCQAEQRLVAERNMEQLRLQYIAREERYVLDGDRQELRLIKNELDDLKRLSYQQQQQKQQQAQAPTPSRKPSLGNDDERQRLFERKVRPGYWCLQLKSFIIMADKRLQSLWPSGSA